MHWFNRRAFIGGASALTAAGVIPARAATPATVRVGSIPVQSYLQPYLGNAAHIFQNAGIDLQIIELANSAAFVAVLLGGSL